VLDNKIKTKEENDPINNRPETQIQYATPQEAESTNEDHTIRTSGYLEEVPLKRGHVRGRRNINVPAGS